MIVCVRTTCRAAGRIFSPGRHEVDESVATMLRDAGFLVRGDAVEIAAKPSMYEKATRRVGKR